MAKATPDPIELARRRAAQFAENKGLSKILEGFNKEQSDYRTWCDLQCLDPDDNESVIQFYIANHG